MEGYITNFRLATPSFTTQQTDLAEWMTQAYLVAASASNRERCRELTEDSMRRMVERYGCGPRHIEMRGHELPDFTHFHWEDMMAYPLRTHPHGVAIDARHQLYNELVLKRCKELLPDPSLLDHEILHVTCTGYVAPSPLQRYLCEVGSQCLSTITPVYHMGCYAALPATRLANSLRSLHTSESETNSGATVVHTELCSLHFDPLETDPEKIVIQSLFADGLISYRVCGRGEIQECALRVMAWHEEQVPDSMHSITWIPGGWGMLMGLRREVPDQILGKVHSALENLLKKAGKSFDKLNSDVVWAIHPGGPRILDCLQNVLGIRDHQIRASREVLRSRGNMSSATIPHIWDCILKDKSSYPSGTKVISIAFGPGITISMNISEVVRI